MSDVKSAHAMDLYRECAHISDQARKYVFGGGHGILFKQITSEQGLDCSSSTSLALNRVALPDYIDGRGRTVTHRDMLPGDRALVSGDFAKWGLPGKGRWFTVWYSGVHVWIQFHGLGRFWRFDTSPWGSGGKGPRMRMLPRPTKSFLPRHWPGL